MTTVMERTNPREKASLLRDPFRGLFDDRDFFLGPFFKGLGRRLGSPWAPDVDVYRQDDHLVVEADLPGVSKEDLEVTIDEGMLTIKGKRKSESEVKEEDYFRVERSSGEFYRRVTLPYEIAPESVVARFQDGILKVELPVPVEKKARRTRIKVR